MSASSNFMVFYNSSVKTVLYSYPLEYSNTLVFLGLGSALGIILMALSYVLSRKRALGAEKLSAYECGFDPFGDCGTEFNIHFYLIGILFLVFDLEVILLFPWAVSIGGLEPFAIWSVVDFLIELTVGFAYVWLVNALEL